jgi:Spermine/spermidine synthase domain
MIVSGQPSSDSGGALSDRPYGDETPRRRLATIRSSFSEIVVDETDTARYLWFGYARQAGVRLNQGEFDFQMALASSQRCFDLADLYHWDPKSMLHVGLGAGNAPMRSALRHSQALVEVIELDPAVLDVAREWFGFETERCNVHIADAFAFLQATDRRWDVIMLDAYLSAGGTSELNVLPSYFSEREFVELVAERVSDDGLLVANLNGALRGAQSSRFLSLLDSIEEAFGNLAVHSVSDRTGEGPALREHPDLELVDEHYIVLASRHRMASAEEILSLAQGAQGSAFVDPDIVTFARNRIDAWRPSAP